MKRIAVIDTGTNSTRLLIADVSGSQVKELERRTMITRLGEGVDETGLLGARAKERVRKCIEDYAHSIAGMKPETTVVLATSSVRDAMDGERFLAEVSRLHGFAYKVLSGLEEARLSFAGAAMDLAAGGRTLLFDVGGGSTEVVIGDADGVDYARSLSLGCVRITERFFTRAPVPERGLEAASAFIDRTLKSEIDKAQLGKITGAVAVAGTVTSLAAIDMGLRRYDRNLVHGHVLSAEAVRKMLKRFSSQAARDIMAIPTMEEGRADVITAGTLIVERILAFTGLDAFTVSEHDILDGAAMAAARGDL